MTTARGESQHETSTRCQLCRNHSKGTLQLWRKMNERWKRNWIPVCHGRQIKINRRHDTLDREESSAEPDRHRNEDSIGMKIAYRWIVSKPCMVKLRWICRWSSLYWAGMMIVRGREPHKSEMMNHHNWLDNTRRPSSGALSNEKSPRSPENISYLM